MQRGPTLYSCSQPSEHLEPVERAPERERRRQLFSAQEYVCVVRARHFCNSYSLFIKPFIIIRVASNEEALLFSFFSSCTRMKQQQQQEQLQVGCCRVQMAD